MEYTNLKDTPVLLLRMRSNDKLVTYACMIYTVSKTSFNTSSIYKILSIIESIENKESSNKQETYLADFIFI